MSNKYNNIFLSGGTSAISLTLNSGLYKCVYWTDTPDDLPIDSQGLVLMFSYNEKWRIHFFMCPHTGQIWKNYAINGIWNGWVRMDQGFEASTTDIGDGVYLDTDKLYLVYE